MPKHKYTLGRAEIIEQLYPAPELADAKLKFKTYTDVIHHYTKNSLKADGISKVNKVSVTRRDGHYHISIDSDSVLEKLITFGERHVRIFDQDHAAKAIEGMRLMKEFGVWNPMANYKVNSNPGDGTSKWNLFPPLGLNVAGQKGLVLMHYPPWAVLTAGTFDNAMTMQRWKRVLKCAGIPDRQISRYATYIDVNPVAAPGSGESEYPNDYFPIMMASAFFDGPPERDFIRSMLELYLTPPDWPATARYTLPLLICGSPLYDPQAPGWFRVAYTDILPQDKDGIPLVDVMQTGTFRVRPDSQRETPYLICNHMIAASVTGQCTNDASKIPNILQYEAQDMVAASFLKIYATNLDISPAEAKAQACQRWYGNAEGTGAPLPPDENDRRILCTLAQMDLFFSPLPTPHPTYTFDEAWERCATATRKDNPCYGNIKPPQT